LDLGETKVSLCRTFGDKDEESVKRLVEETFKDFLKGEYWEWKYKLNPGFDSLFVAVAEKDGKIIGCNHWLLRRLRISSSIEVKAVLGADIAVSPEYRGHGIGKSLLLFLRSSPALSEKRVILSYMFAEPNLGERLYKPVAGYIPAPSTTVSYLKLLSWRKVKDSVEKVNEKLKVEGKNKFSKGGLKVMFQISGAPSLLLKLSEKGVEIFEGVLENANVTVVSDLSTLSVFKERKGNVWNLIKALLKRKLKIKGSFSNLIRFYRSFWLIKEVFSGKIS
jgi:GNAT superfamily N-acetyltransferase